MRNNYELYLPTTSTSASASTSTPTGKRGYKFWVLSAVLLLAFWSMFTGSVSLKWSSGHLTRFSDDIRDDLDILEVEERKKVVIRLWDVYTRRTGVRLPRFWSEAFEAAYDYLTSDVPGVRDVAVSEIAKLSLRSFNLDPLPVKHTSLRQTGKKSKVAMSAKS